MRWIEATARVGPGGAVLAALAAALAAVGLMAPPSSGPIVLAQWGASLVLTICLCHVQVPTVLRAGLIAAMLGVALGGAVGADPIGAKATERRIERDADAYAIERARDEAASHGAASGLRGARITLDGDWGRRIAGPLDGTLGGPHAAALSVAGTAVGAPGDRPRVAVTWSIARGGTRVQCGTTTIAGPSGVAIVDAARGAIGRAVDASAAHEAASCG